MKVWKIAIKPGKPFVFGEYGGRYWLGLPGNPVSAFVTFLLLARPFLLRMQGCAETRFTEVLGKALSPVHNRGDRRHFLRSRLNLDGTVEILPKQGSHHLSTLAKTNALLDLRPGASVEVGDLVRVLLIPDH